MKRPSAHATVSESGEFLRLILRSNRIGLWSVELETGEVSWSPEILDILGRTQEELGDTDDGLFSSIHEDDRPDVIAAIERAVATGESFGVAFRILHPDGGFRWIDARGCFIRNSEGMATQLHVIGIDITERRRFATEAIEAAERLRAIVDTAVDGIVTVTSKGIIESINPATLRIFGYDATELIGQNVNMLMPEPYHSRHDKYIANYEQTRQARIIGIGRKVVGRRKSGVTFPMDLAVSEFQTSGGRMYTGLIRDVTEREQSEQEIRNLNMTLEMRVTARTAELQELNRELEGFCYSIAHDLRQRLRNVSTISALLSADHGDQFHQEAAERWLR